MGVVTPLSETSTERIILCLVADAATIDRVAGAMHRLQAGLIDQAFDVVLVVPESVLSDVVAANAALVRYRPGSGLFARWEQRRLIGAVQRQVAAFRHEGPVIVHALSGPALHVAAPIAAAVEGTLVVTLSSEAAFVDPILPELARRCAGIMVPCRAIGERVEHTSFAGRLVETVCLGVESGNVPAAFRFSDRAPSLIHVGPLTLNAGCDTMLRAAKHVMEQYPNLLVFLVGKGPAEASLRQLARILNIHLSVTFTGRLRNWRSALAGADMFCLPRAVPEAREEPLQALADGLAVVAAEGCPYDALRDGQTALLFPENAVTELANRICRFLDDRQFARGIAATAQSYMREHHTVDGMVAGFARFYCRAGGRTEILAHPGVR